MSEIKEFKLPVTSEEVEESLVVLLYKEEGEFIKTGENLLEIQTEKAVFEIESPFTGIIKKLFVKRGDNISVGQVISTIELKEIHEYENVSELDYNNAEKTNNQANNNKTAAIKASPRIKKIARENNIDISEIIGSGPDGKIVEQDIYKYLNPEQGADTNFELLDISNTRYITARKMMKSLNETAQLTETAKADITLLSKNRKKLAKDLTLTDWIFRAVVLALSENPGLNSAWSEKGIMQYKNINLGVAINVDEGLFVPVIKDAGAYTIFQLHNKILEFTKKAKSLKLTNEDLSGGTFTITNLGSFGIQYFTPIINFPEAAILGLGKAESKLIMDEGQIKEIFELPLSLTFDHRIVDGAPAAKFIQLLINFLKSPENLLQ